MLFDEVSDGAASGALPADEGAGGECFSASEVESRVATGAVSRNINRFQHKIDFKCVNI